MLGRRGLWGNLTLTVAVILLLLFCLFPFVQILSTSLKYQADWGNPSLIPTQLQLGRLSRAVGMGTDRRVGGPAVDRASARSTRADG